jgi:hypothetical protein
LDILAKAEGNPSPDEFSVMMRALLGPADVLVIDHVEQPSED